MRTRDDERHAGVCDPPLRIFDKRLSGIASNDNSWRCEITNRGSQRARTTTELEPMHAIGCLQPIDEIASKLSTPASHELFVRRTGGPLVRDM